MHKTWKDYLLITFLILISLGVFVIWAAQLAGGAFPAGLLAYQECNIPLAHLIAEFLMAGLTLVGALSWLRGAGWGRRLVLFGLGMFVYSSINSMGWVFHNQPATAIPMIITLLVAVIALPSLLRQSGVWRKRRTRRRTSETEESGGCL